MSEETQKFIDQIREQVRSVLENKDETTKNNIVINILPKFNNLKQMVAEDGHYGFEGSLRDK